MRYTGSMFKFIHLLTSLITLHKVSQIQAQTAPAKTVYFDSVVSGDTVLVGTPQEHIVPAFNQKKFDQDMIKLSAVLKRDRLSAAKNGYPIQCKPWQTDRN